MNTSASLVTHHGGCHCGAVAFEVDAPAALAVHECNCSICSMSGYWHLIVPANRFRLLQGADTLTEYTFNTGLARHLFCRRLRRQVLLCAAIESRWLQHQRALPRPRHDQRNSRSSRSTDRTGRFGRRAAASIRRLKRPRAHQRPAGLRLLSEGGVPVVPVRNGWIVCDAVTPLTIVRDDRDSWLALRGTCALQRHRGFACRTAPGIRGQQEAREHDDEEEEHDSHTHYLPCSHGRGHDRCTERAGIMMRDRTRGATVRVSCVLA